MPVLDELQRAYRNDGLIVLNLSDESSDKVAGWLEEHPMQTIHGIVGADPALETPFDAMTQARPVTFVIDRDGVIRDTAMGKMTRARFEQMIRRWL
jgi:peroxiredoxin